MHVEIQRFAYLPARTVGVLNIIKHGGGGLPVSEFSCMTIESQSLICDHQGSYRASKNFTAAHGLTWAIEPIDEASRARRKKSIFKSSSDFCIERSGIGLFYETPSRGLSFNITVHGDALIEFKRKIKELNMQDGFEVIIKFGQMAGVLPIKAGNP